MTIRGWDLDPKCRRMKVERQKFKWGTVTKVGLRSRMTSINSYDCNE